MRRQFVGLTPQQAAGCSRQPVAVVAARRRRCRRADVARCPDGMTVRGRKWPWGGTGTSGGTAPRGTCLLLPDEQLADEQLAEPRTNRACIALADCTRTCVPPGPLTSVFHSDVGILLVLAESIRSPCQGASTSRTVTSPLSATSVAFPRRVAPARRGGAASLADRSATPSNAIRKIGRAHV